MNKGGTKSETVRLVLAPANEGDLERSQIVSVHLVKIANTLKASVHISA